MLQHTAGLSDLNLLSRIATGRSSSVFKADLETAAPRLREEISGKRILVIGGAGTIGSQTAALIAGYAPKALHVADISENELVELVRNLRSRAEPFEVSDFRTYPLDYGAPCMERALDEGGPYDAVLNFAAIKHVRSEGSFASLLHMLDTNLLKTETLIGSLERRGYAGRFFCVSTDKAANPVSLMGASKRVMEHLIFSRALRPGSGLRANSARFANVAFSNGSLLEGFIRRFGAGQPIACPAEVRRYFVSPRESGEICMLAAFCAPAGRIAIPDFASAIHLVRLEDVARDFIRAQGLEPAIYDDEDKARGAVALERARGRHPLLITPLDTSGEKPYEEFVGSGEHEEPIGFQTLSSVGYVPCDRQALERLFGMIRAAVGGDASISKADITAAIAETVPNFRHIETGKHLDQRM